jgi:hypothetical protein
LLGHDAALAQDPADHAAGDVLVVLNLTLVVGEDFACDLPSRGSAPIEQQLSQHHRLVDVRHAHPAQQKVLKFGETHILRLFSRGP